jgi:hypothetical protein
MEPIEIKESLERHLNSKKIAKKIAKKIEKELDDYALNYDDYALDYAYCYIKKWKRKVNKLLDDVKVVYVVLNSIDGVIYVDQLKIEYDFYAINHKAAKSDLDLF